jgi:membrane associated rhomboid family serine protease
MNDPFPFGRPSTRQPVFNLPPVIVATVGALLAVHAVRTWVLTPETDLQVLLNFAFIPIRETAPEGVSLVIPGGAARVWTFITYAFLHGDWAHVSFNALWLAAFGSPLARRFGIGRFLLFSATGAAAGALLHLAIYPSDVAPLIGASAAISAHMAAVARFALGGTSMRRWGLTGDEVYRQPAAPLLVVMQDRRVLMFLGVWFGLNLIFGLSSIGEGIASGAIAWDAHLGGFFAGLLLFSVFDPIRRAPAG